MMATQQLSLWILLSVKDILLDSENTFHVCCIPYCLSSQPVLSRKSQSILSSHFLGSLNVFC